MQKQGFLYRLLHQIVVGFRQNTGLISIRALIADADM